MKKYKHILILIFACAFIFSTCKKYPEGGFTKRGDKRAINRGWKLIKYEVNGIDSTDLINFNGNDNYKKISFFIIEKSPLKMSLLINGNNGVITNFNSDNSKIICSTSPSVYPSVKHCNAYILADCYKLIFTPELSLTEWTIDKLTLSEFNMHAALKNNYVIKLKKA